MAADCADDAIFRAILNGFSLCARLSFLEDVPNVDLKSVLALNRATKKVDWIHVFKNEGFGTNTPKIAENHLYQLICIIPSIYSKRIKYIAVDLLLA